MPEDHGWARRRRRRGGVAGREAGPAPPALRHDDDRLQRPAVPQRGREVLLTGEPVLPGVENVGREQQVETARTCRNGGDLS